MTILKQFLKNTTILKDPEKTKLLCEFIENMTPENTKKEEIYRLNLSLMRINDGFSENILVTKDMSLKSYIENIITDYEKSIHDFKRYSYYENSKSYNEKDFHERESIIKKGYSLDVLKVYMEHHDIKELSELLSTAINNMQKDRNIYEELRIKTLNIIENPLLSLQEMENISCKEFESFKEESIFQNIEEMFYEQERVFGFVYMKINKDGFMRKASFLEEIGLKEDIDLKKRIYISYLKIYSLSLQDPALAKIKYLYLCNSSYIKTMSLYFNDTEEAIKKRMHNKNNNYFNDERSKKENSSKEDYLKVKDELQYYKDKIKSFRMNTLSLISFLNYSNSENPLTLKIRKKGLGYFGCFNHTYDYTFNLKRTREEQFDLIGSNNKNCSFLNKEKFIAEIETDYVRQFLFPEVKERFIITVEN